MQMALYLTRPITASYAVSLGASVAAAGFVAGLLATAAVVVRPLSGSFSDLFSKKNLLVAAAALFAVSAFGCATATTTLMLGAWCAVQGFAFAFKSTLIISMASLVVPRESLGSGVGWLSIAYTVACALGPAIGSSLGGSFGYPVVYLLSACLLVVGFVLAVTFKAPAASSHHAPLLRGADVRSKMSLAVLFRQDQRSPGSGCRRRSRARCCRDRHGAAFADSLGFGCLRCCGVHGSGAGVGIRGASGGVGAKGQREEAWKGGEHVLHRAGHRNGSRSGSGGFRAADMGRSGDLRIQRDRDSLVAACVFGVQGGEEVDGLR